jgi:hypothetical protein
MKEEKKSQIIWKCFLVFGWAIFWLSLFLPVNTSLGGLTDAGRPYYGFLNLFYSIVAILIIPTAILNAGKDFSFSLNMVLTAGVGVCNLVMIFSPLILLFRFRIQFLTKWLMVFCAVYSCVVGSSISYHFYPIRYGHYIWCLSFIIEAVAFNLRFDDFRRFA